MTGRTQKRPQGWWEWWEEPSLMSGSAHAVSDGGPDVPAVILVPDGAGDYREHPVVERPKGRMGFR